MGPTAAGLVLQHPFVLLAPLHGLTLESQPTVYWILTEPLMGEFDIVFRSEGDATHKTYLLGSREPGLQREHLADLGIELESGRRYHWWIVHRGGKSPLVHIERTQDAELRKRLATASPQDRAREMASRGIWYDALDELTRAIDASPGDERLQRMRESLLKQAGLPPLRREDFR